MLPLLLLQPESLAHVAVDFGFNRRAVAHLILTACRPAASKVADLERARCLCSVLGFDALQR